MAKHIENTADESMEMLHLLNLMQAIDYQKGPLIGHFRGSIKRWINNIEQFNRNAVHNLLNQLPPKFRKVAIEDVEENGAHYWDVADQLRNSKDKANFLAMCKLFNKAKNPAMLYKICEAYDNGDLELMENPPI